MQPNLEHFLYRISSVIACIFLSLFIILRSSDAQSGREAVPLKPKEIVATASIADQAPIDQAFSQLARRVAILPGAGSTMRLEFHVDQSFTESRIDSWTLTLEQELEKHHVSVTGDPTAEPLRIGIVRTPTQVVFSAGIRVGEHEEVRIVLLPRSQAVSEATPAAAVRLDRQLVYESRNRILDASSLSNGTEGGMAILEIQVAGLVALKIGRDGTTVQTGSMAGANLGPTRDPKGALKSDEQGVELNLPGQICSFRWDNAAALKCRAAKATEPIEKGPTLLTSPCDGRSWKLTTSGGDWTSAEKLALLPARSSNENSVAVSSQFPGPILNMNVEQNPSSVLVVTRNLETGNYEVYKVILACGN